MILYVLFCDVNCVYCWDEVDSWYKVVVWIGNFMGYIDNEFVGFDVVVGGNIVVGKWMWFIKFFCIW